MSIHIVRAAALIEHPPTVRPISYTITPSGVTATENVPLTIGYLGDSAYIQTVGGSIEVYGYQHTADSDGLINGGDFETFNNCYVQIYKEYDTNTSSWNLKADSVSHTTGSVTPLWSKGLVSQNDRLRLRINSDLLHRNTQGQWYCLVDCDYMTQDPNTGDWYKPAQMWESFDGLIATNVNYATIAKNQHTYVVSAHT